MSSFLRLIGQALARADRAFAKFCRALVIAVGIVVAALVVLMFVGSIAEGWYFGRCDRPRGLCEERHIVGITMSRDGPPKQESEASAE